MLPFASCPQPGWLHVAARNHEEASLKVQVHACAADVYGLSKAMITPCNKWHLVRNVTDRGNSGQQDCKGQRQEGQGECLLDVAGHCAYALTAVVVACASQLTF